MRTVRNGARLLVHFSGQGGSSLLVGSELWRPPGEGKVSPTHTPSWSFSAWPAAGTLATPSRFLSHADPSWAGHLPHQQQWRPVLQEHLPATWRWASALSAWRSSHPPPRPPQGSSQSKLKVLLGKGEVIITALDRAVIYRIIKIAAEKNLAQHWKEVQPGKKK